MSKQEEMYTFWTENTRLTREVAIHQVIEKFEVTYETARTYYPKWRKEFLKPKLSPVGQPRQIIEKEYKKPVQEEKKEQWEPWEPVLNVLKTNEEEIEAITAEKAESEATTLKEEKAEVVVPGGSEKNTSRLEVTKMLKVKGNYIDYDSITEDVRIIQKFSEDTIFKTLTFKKSNLDDLLAELQELKEVLKEGEKHIE